MYIPRGYTEEQVIDCITRIVNLLSHQFSFGYFDADDMKQEGFIYAMSALPDYNPDNKQGCSLDTFLHTHIKRRFLNLQRNKLYRNTPPCSKCPFNNSMTDECEEYGDRRDCPKWTAWSSRNNAKRNIMEPCDISELSNSVCINFDDVESQFSNAELLEYVSNRIPLHMRADYLRFLEGAKLTKAKRREIVDLIKNITREKYGDEIEEGCD